jgi:DNA-binding NarL/FixJ family response regulator
VGVVRAAGRPGDNVTGDASPCQRGATDIVIVDDHLLLAEAIGAGLRQRGIAARVIKPAPPGELIGALRAEWPQLVLLDLDLGAQADAVALIAPLTVAGIKVLMLSEARDGVRLGEAVKAGALGYCLKSAGFARLMSDIAVALSDGRLLDPAERSALLTELAEARAAHDHALAPFRSLTARERKTLQALGDGMTVTEIAHAWMVSEATVRTHIRAVLRKLGAQSQLAAVTSAFHHGWLRPATARARRTAAI